MQHQANPSTNDCELEYVEGFTFSKNCSSVLSAIKNFEVYDDDIWICSMPKSGTTWVQEMVWLIAHDLNYTNAEVETSKRMPFIEFSGVLPHGIKKAEVENPGLDQYFDSVVFAKKAKRPRIIKTHLPFIFLPLQIQTFERRPKVIFVYRNIKDACVSYYYHYKIFMNFHGDFNQFAQLFLSNKVIYAPLVDGVKSYWQHKEMSNIFMIRYEDMIEDLHKVILNVCQFLKKAILDNDIQKLIKHLSFESMRNNKFVNKRATVELVNRANCRTDNKAEFLRQGKSGTYRNDMSVEIEKLFDEYLKKALVDTALQL